MTPTERDILKVSLENTAEAFFRKKAQKKSKLIIANGQATKVERDAMGLLAVLSDWVGELIANAPEHMRDNLFMAFADNVVQVAGIKEAEAPVPTHEEAEMMQ